MMNTINWKLKEHRQILDSGVKHNLLLDLVSTKYKKNAYEMWKKFPRERAEQLGCTFSDKTPSDSLREVFVENIYNVKGFVPKAGEVVVDVGANYGDTAIWWSKIHGAQVHAFEPLTNVYTELERNVSFNSANVVTYNTALGSGERISGTDDGYMLTFSNSAASILFDSRKLDDFNFERVDLLKIDVEGFEYSVLKGASSTIQKHMPRIILETHSSSLFSQCDSFLRQFGYSIREEGPRGTTYLSWMDQIRNLFYSPS